MSIYNPKYLTKRPFLIINTSLLPGANAGTQVKSWSQTNNWNVAEQVLIVDRVLPVHLQVSTFIIDVLEDQVVKNGFHGYDAIEAKKYYLEKYKDKLTQALDVWATNEARKRVINQIKIDKIEYIPSPSDGDHASTNP